MGARDLSCNAYLSDLVAVFQGRRLAMTMADLEVSFLPERSIFSTGDVPRSFLISSGWPSRLHTHTQFISNALEGLDSMTANWERERILKLREIEFSH